MPLYSDHNYYYGSGQPPPYYLPSSPYTPVTSRISAPHSFSYLSPISAMLSAGIGLNPTPRGMRSYTPMLSSISETSSPVVPRRDIGNHRSSPRHLAGKTYFRQPRPVVIDTENIDVSKRKKDDNKEEESTPGLISRGRTTVRMHTKRPKENPELKKKKSQAELLMEKYLIKEKPIKEVEEAPKRKRIWEEREEEKPNTPARGGTIKRSNTVHKKMTAQLPLSEVEVQKQEDEVASQRKMSIDLLKEEAALFDCMIQEELGSSNRKEMVVEEEDPDKSEESAKHKTKREIIPYAKKKSSRNLTEIESGMPTGKRKSHLHHKKRSSNILPIGDITPSASQTDCQLEHSESLSKINKRRSTKKKKNASGALKFKIDALHVEEKSSPKLLRKFQYEVIVEEGNLGKNKSVKRSPLDTENYLTGGVQKNIPEALKQNNLVDTELLGKTTNTGSSESVLNNTCDNDCDIGINTVNMPNNKSTEVKKVPYDEGKTSYVEDDKSSRNTDEYMDKFRIKGSLQRQLHVESDSEDKKCPSILESTKKQKTDSLELEDLTTDHSKLKTVTRKADETKEQEQNTDTKLVFEKNVETIADEVDHSISPNTEDEVKKSIYSERELGRPQINNSHLEKRKDVVENISQNVLLLTSHKTKTPELGRKALKDVTSKSNPNTPILSKKKVSEITTAPEQKKLEPEEDLNKIKTSKISKQVLTSLPKSDPSSPVLSQKEIPAASTNTIVSAQKELSNIELNKSETKQVDQNGVKNVIPKSDPNSPVFSKKKTSNLSTDKASDEQSSGTPKFGKKLPTNSLPRSDQSTPVLQKKEIAEALISLQKESVNEESIKSGTPKFDKKLPTNSTPKSDPSTPLLSKKGITQPSFDKTNADQKIKMEESNKNKTPTFGRKIQSSTPKSEIDKPDLLEKTAPEVSTNAAKGDETKPSLFSESQPGTPVLPKKETTQLSKNKINFPQNEKQVDENKTPKFAKKVLMNAKSTLESIAPGFNEKEIIHSPDSKNNAVNNESVVEEIHKSGTPKFGRKLLTSSTAKSEPNTPILSKKEVAKPPVNPIDVIEKDIQMEPSKTSNTPESRRKILPNLASKSVPNTPVLQKKEITQLTNIKKNSEDLFDKNIKKLETDTNLMTSEKHLLENKISSSKNEKPTQLIDSSEPDKGILTKEVKNENQPTPSPQSPFANSPPQSPLEKRCPQSPLVTPPQSPLAKSLPQNLSVKSPPQSPLAKSRPQSPSAPPPQSPFAKSRPQSPLAKSPPQSPLVKSRPQSPFVKSPPQSPLAKVKGFEESKNKANISEIIVNEQSSSLITNQISTGTPAKAVDLDKEFSKDKCTTVKLEEIKSSNKIIDQQTNAKPLLTKKAEEVKNVSGKEDIVKKPFEIDEATRNKEKPSLKQGDITTHLNEIVNVQKSKNIENVNKGWAENKDSLDKVALKVEGNKAPVGRINKTDKVSEVIKKDKSGVEGMKTEKTSEECTKDKLNREKKQGSELGAQNVKSNKINEPIVSKADLTNKVGCEHDVDKAVCEKNVDSNPQVEKQLEAKMKKDLPKQIKSPVEKSAPPVEPKTEHSSQLADQNGEKNISGHGISKLDAGKPLVNLGKDITNKNSKDSKEKKKRIKSESDAVDDSDITTDKKGSTKVLEGQGNLKSEKSKSLDEKKSEKSQKKKKKSKEKSKDQSKEGTSIKTEDGVQSSNCASVKQSDSAKTANSTTEKASIEMSKSTIRLMHFINKCVKLSEDNESISVEMSDDDLSSSSSEYTSDSDCTSDSDEDSDDDTSSECDVNCHRKCEKLMPNLCGVNQKLIVEALSSLRKGSSSESRDHGSPTRRHSNAALSLDEVKSDSRAAHGRVTPPATTIPKFRKYAMEDFQFLKVLGKGSFGKVLLAELRGTQYYYAVKCLKKDVVLEDDDVECTLIERKVLALGTNHPYLCHLFCTFQTDSHLFFVMEYLNGGDLMFHIQQQGRFDEGRARFYAAEIVSGLKFLHKKGIVYRDLKLDNILLDFDGHVRIADFGMCKLQIYLDRTADTFCGTPDYMAPEIIKGLKYNQCVDWWSFGILMYEMLVGQSPFSGCDEDDLFWCICNRQPHYPRFITLEAKRILMQLLEKEANKRLGSCENGAAEVMAHSFFTNLDWDRLERRELMPPFKPNVKHPLDVHYFDKHFTAERACLTPIDPSILQSMDQTQFQGFSYTNPNVTD